MLPYVPDGEDADLVRRRRGRRRRDPEVRRRRRALRLGGRPPAEPAVERDDHLRGSTSRASRSSTSTSARTCAAPTPGSRPSRRSSTCTSLGVTAVELLPIHHIADEALPRRRAASRTTGATARSASSRRTRCTPRPGRAASRCAEFKGMVKALHRAGIEVILDVVYNHTAEGNHLGPMLVVPRHRQRVVLPARRRTTRASTWTTPAPATASTRRTRACCG